MTTQAHYSKVFENVVGPVSVNMMNFKFNSFPMTCNTAVWKIFKSSSNIDIFLSSIFKSFYSFSFKVLRVLFSESFILTLCTTIGAVFSFIWGKISNLSTVFASNWNKISSIPVMKAAPTAKPFFLAAYGRKFLTALLTRLDRCSFFLAVFVPACHRAKSLPFVIGFKRVLAVVAYFIHALIIPYLFINDQAQQQEVQNDGL